MPMNLASPFVFAGSILCFAFTGAHAQALKIDAQNTLTLPAELADCSAPDTQAGNGIIEQSANCPARGGIAGGITRYEITVVTGGGHLREPERRLTDALVRAEIPKSELNTRLVRKEWKTRGKAMKVVCVQTLYDDAQSEVTCVKDEPQTRVEFIAESPKPENAWALMEDLVKNSELK